MKNKYLVLNDSVDPYYNLALEEYLLLNYTQGEIIMLWQNKNTIVVGRNQNAMEEINQQYVREQGIHVVRRTTGGGAVYHDLGNLNYSLILDNLPDDKETLAQMSRVSAPIVEALKDLGVPAVFSGRNDILAEGKKISGTAQRVHKDRLLQHGCLLFDSDLSTVARSLNVRAEKFQSKAVKSVRSRVGNIKDYLPAGIGIEQLKQSLTKRLTGDGMYEQLVIPEEERREVMKLAEDKYRQWEWTYGHPLKCTIHNYKKYDGGTVEVYQNVENGIIKDCVMYGDFMAVKPASDVAERLKGCKYLYESVLNVLKHFKIKEYFGTIEAAEVAACICCVEKEEEQ